MKKKSIKLVFIFCFILLFSLSPISPLNFLFQLEDKNAVAREQQIISEYQEWTEDKEIDGSVEIEEGAVLVIKKGIKITFKKNSSLYVNGKLFVKGTKNEPVKFSMDGIDEITFSDDELIEYYGYRILVTGEAYFKNADFSGGGDIFQQYLKGNNILNKTYAASFGGAIVVQGGKLNVSECNFHDNVGGIEIQWLGNGNNVHVNKTIFDNNYFFDAKNYSGSNGYVLDFRYNWWRGPNGPEIANSNYKTYKYVFGNINVSSWLTSKEFKDPVIIIPGILGSEKQSGIWQIDPVYHTYDNLYGEIINNGYVPEENLFTFPYEWRNSNVENAKLLKKKIQAIKQQENWPSVDIVAHSMGGLLTREYIESDNYDNDIDQLITLGTPNNGAPEAYLKWEAGAFLFNLSEIYLKHRFSQEAEENGYEDVFHYIQEKVPSVKELLPVYGYLYDVENNNKLIKYATYNDNYPINDFLKNLNDSNKKINLLKVELNKIIGNVNDNGSTISGFNVIVRYMGEHWEHGYPLGFEVLIGGRGFVIGKGDRTVPVDSAKSENIYSDNILEINSSHRELPDDAQKDVVEILTGTRPNTEVRHGLIHNILFVSVFSPIDIQIISPSERKIGKDFSNNSIINEIDGAFYTGFDTENEFITIPNPEDGEYKILTQGTDNGEYKIEVAKISENENDLQNAKESAVEITGTAISGSEEELKIELAGDEISVGEPKDTTPPIINASATIDPNENGWYKNDVTIRFTAEDNESGIEGESEKDVTISSEGENQSITETFNDIAGNTASKTIFGINIDKTAPETETEILGTKGENDWFVSDVEIKFSGNDNLSEVNKTYFSLDNASFEAGNSVNISDDGNHVLKYYSDDLAGNIESEKELLIKIDKTAPEIKIISPENRKYLNNEILEIKYGIIDLNDTESQVELDNNFLESNEIDLSLKNLGNHNVAILANDEAGNTSELSETFEIVTDIKAIIFNVDHYFDESLITSRNAKYFLEIKLRHLQERIRLLDIFESKLMPQWAKEKVVASFEREINKEIEGLIFQIENHKKLSEAISPEVKSLLIESLKFIKR